MLKAEAVALSLPSQFVSPDCALLGRCRFFQGVCGHLGMQKLLLP